MIAVTDHNAIGGNILLRKLGINVIPGINLGAVTVLNFWFILLQKMTWFIFIKDMLNLIKIKSQWQRLRKISNILTALKNFECYKSIPHIAGVAQKNFIKKQRLYL